MTPHIPEEFSTRLIDWSPFVIMGNTMPPRDPDEDEEDEETLAPCVNAKGKKLERKSKDQGQRCNRRPTRTSV
jgi:hypothetical protein